MFAEYEFEECPFAHEQYGEAASLLHLNPAEDDHWVFLLKLLGSAVADTKALGPLERILSIVRSNGCRSVVVEHRYVDRDFLSEYAIFWSKRFADTPLITKRVHFFASPLELRDLYQTRPDRSYLGYTIVRPTPLGPTGRTVVMPDATRLGESPMLTWVDDDPSMFGNKLKVRGVPYLQQDGELTRCAHVAAWTCQYVAWRNEVIGRHLTGQIAMMPSPESSATRPMPSVGLNFEQLQGIFSRLEIPATFYNIADLPDLAAPLHQRDARGDCEPETEVEFNRRILRERVHRVVCPNLNSGLPVLVLTAEPDDHAFTLVGWGHGDTGVHLISCNDDAGPYDLIADPVEHIDEDGEWSYLMVPAPADVFLSGVAAESHARTLVQLGADRADQDKGDEQDADFAAFAGELEWLDQKISTRSRLMEGRDLKEVIENDRPESVKRLYRMAHLPRWVWVVEFHDRTLRQSEEACVVAEIIFDSTSHDALPLPCLSSTMTLAKDARERLRGAPPELCTAPGPGSPWRSLITGRSSRGQTKP